MFQMEHVPKWLRYSTYLEPILNTLFVRATRFEINDANSYIDEDASHNMTFTDAVTSTKTLAELAAGGSGDVVGPGASTDNAIVRFHETTGKVIQDYTSNPPTISDTGDVTIDGDMTADNVDGSATLLTGGVISEGTTGTVTISALTALLRKDTGATDDLVYVTLAEQANKTMASADTLYHVGLDYNSGSPQVLVQEGTFNRTTEIGLGKCMKDGSDAVHFQNGGMRLQDGVSKLQRRATSLRGSELASGCAIADVGGASKYFTIAKGVIYHGIHRLTPFADAPYNPFNSNDDKFIYVYGDTSNGFTFSDGTDTVINNTQYYDGAGALATLTANKYGTHWVYIHPDDNDVYVMYGEENDFLAAAELSQPTSDIPIELDDFGILIGRIIIKKDATAFATITMVTDTVFTGASVADHGELSGLDSDDHPQYVLITDLEDTPTEDEANKATTSEYIFDHDARDATSGVQGHATAAQITKLDGITALADVTGDNAPQAHHDLHDPDDGADALDCAAPNALLEVQAAAEGSAHEFARADHDHAIVHDITDNALVTIDGSPADTEMAVWTGDGLDGKTYAEMFALLFSVDIPEQIAFTLDDTLSADGKYCVTMALDGTTGEEVEFGECVYFKAGDSKWWLAQGDAEATVAPMTGLVITAGTTSAEDPVKVALMGEVRADGAFPALTIGAAVFIDPDTAGLVTTIELTTGEFQKAIGWAKTANVVVLTGNPDWVKVG